MLKCALGLFKDSGGAVAPTVALSLVALIAAGGLAFDYARLASMDTELQNAADQAALAAASQLDRQAGACARANAAAQTLVTNRTLFANDGNASGVGVTLLNEPACDAIGNIRFYQDKAKTTPATLDTNARFVEVTVNGRTAEYAFTPIVGALSSGVIAATAFAGMGSAICKVPPLMMCNPNPGTFFNADLLPSQGGWRGVGLKLFMGGGNSWGPGAFGWLDVGAVNNGTPDQNYAIGMDNPNTNCVAEADVEVDTGVSAAVLDALNVRFDIFQGNFADHTCFGNSACSPAANASKDLMRLHAPSASSCGIHAAQWRLAPDDDQYLPQDAAGNDANVKIMGHPMDICHYPTSGRSCGTVNPRFGDGVWRPDIYFATNHPSLSLPDGSNWAVMTGLSATAATRYDFYRWEQGVPGYGNANSRLPAPNPVTYDFNGNNNDGAYTQHGAAVCKPPGLPPGGGQPDRRVVAAAIVDNCDEISGGSSELDVGGWTELFLVQPSLARTAAGVTANEIYVEIIGNTNPTDSGAVAQVVTRDVPYLIE